jgi:hypothetical protein
MTKQFPIQGTAHSHPSHRAKIGGPVYMAAYEVYRQICGEQKALIEGDCRGGFGLTELVGYLYARGFPRSEWRQRFDEACTDADLES